MLSSGHNVANIDIAPPKVSSQTECWQKCDVLDQAKLDLAFARFKPTHVIHLTARTDVEGKTIEDYMVNTVGTSNVLSAINKVSSVERVIITSTQFVYQNGGSVPSGDRDYAPYTVYGESKVMTEELTRNACLKCIWTIIRPTNIWGPWHPRYPFEFWKTLSQGRYLHPGKKKVMRSYGYVGNVIWQIIKYLKRPRIKSTRKCFTSVISLLISTSG